MHSCNRWIQVITPCLLLVACGGGEEGAVTVKGQRVTTKGLEASSVRPAEAGAESVSDRRPQSDSLVPSDSVAPSEAADTPDAIGARPDTSGDKAEEYFADEVRTPGSVEDGNIGTKEGSNREGTRVAYSQGGFFEDRSEGTRAETSDAAESEAGQREDQREEVDEVASVGSSRYLFDNPMNDPLAPVNLDVSESGQGTSTNNSGRTSSFVVNDSGSFTYGYDTADSATDVGPVSVEGTISSDGSVLMKVCATRFGLCLDFNGNESS